MTNNTLESENKTFAPARRVRSAIVVAANPLCIISFLPQGTNITLTTIAIHPLSLSLSLGKYHIVIISLHYVCFNIPL